MRTRPLMGMSSRFAVRISLIIIACALMLLVALLYIRRFPVSFDKPLARPNVSRQTQNKPLAISNEPKERLPLIYQPPAGTTILRALLLFYPNDQESTFVPEFRWFYRSWTEMMANESTLWRTDIIVYATENAPLFKSLGCVYEQIRTTADEKPQCRVFSYTRIKNRASKHAPTSKYQTVDEQRSRAMYQHLRNYGYIDSINTVFEFSASFAMYDVILRTDMDCFLTDNFALYIPYNRSVLVGHGGYSTEFNNKRLKRIARDMQWQYADQKGLGSTWYGAPDLIHHMADYTIQAMTHLVVNEFTTPEREQKLGVMLWPEWHFGVLLLYGGHLAINHLTASENSDIRLAGQLLDQGVTATDRTDLRKHHRLHLHCWHGSNPFSKFDFKAGKYDRIDPTTLLSDTSASGYAMRMALESKSLSLEQLKQKLLDIRK